MKNMKKIFSIFSVLFLALVLVACKKDEAVDPAQEKLDNAYDTVMVLFENPQEITSNLSLPTSMAGGVTVEWSSSEPGAASVGTPSGGFVTITINRTPGVDTNAVLTAKFSIPAENSDEILTRSRDIPIKIIASADLNIPRGNIGEILAIVHPESDPSNKADKLDVNLQNVTIFAQGEGSLVFGYDGTGIIQFYGGTNEWEVGKVYNVSGLLEWYFGIWEVIDPVATLVEDATPQFPEQEAITDPHAFVVDLVAAGEHEASFRDLTDGNFESIWATVTGTIFMSDSNAGNNYNTFLLSSDFDTENPGVPGTQGNPAEGFMFYYGTNGFNEVRAYNGIEVTMDVVIYTYRSNNHAFAIYYTGDEIIADLSDEDYVDIDGGLINIVTEFTEDQEGGLVLPTEGQNDTTIEWALKDDTDAQYVDLETGDITAPEEGRVEVVLVATVSKGDASKEFEFTLLIGEYELITVAEAVALESGNSVMIKGIVTNKFANGTYGFQDATGAIAIYTFDVTLTPGLEYTLIGEKDNYNGLHQLKNVVVEESAPALFPEAFDITSIFDNNEELAKHIAKYVRVNDLEVVEKPEEASNGNIIFDVKIGETTMELRFDSRAGNIPTKDALLALEVGEKFSVETNLAWFNNPQLGWGPNSKVLGADAEIGLPEVEGSITIADFLELEDGEEGLLVGVVTSLAPYNSFSIEDDSGAVALRISGFNSSSEGLPFKVGDVVEFTGKKNTFNGLVQAELVGSVDEDFVVHKGTFGRLPVVNLNEVGLTAEKLLPYQSRMATLRNAEVTEVNIDSYGTIQLKVKVNDEEVAVRWDNRVSWFDNTVMAALKVGDVIDVVGVTITWFNNPQLAVEITSSIVLVEAGEPVEPTVGEVVTAQYNGDETISFEKDVDLNQASLINLDETMFTVTGSLAGSHQNAIGLNKSGQIRLYASRTDGKGNRLNISIKEGFKITKIEIDFAAGNNSPFMGVLELDSQVIDLIESEVANTVIVKDGLSINGFVIGNNQDSGDKSTQLWINSIVITYSPVE